MTTTKFAFMFCLWSGAEGYIGVVAPGTLPATPASSALRAGYRPNPTEVWQEEYCGFGSGRLPSISRSDGHKVRLAANELATTIV